MSTQVPEVQAAGVANEGWIAGQARNGIRTHDTGPARRPWALAARAVLQRLLPWLLPLALLTVWQLASSLGWLSTRVLPAPSEVLHAASQLAQSGELWTHVRVSAGRAFLGLAVGGGLGLLFGLLTGSVRTAETLLDSTFQMLRN